MYLKVTTKQIAEILARENIHKQTINQVIERLKFYDALNNDTEEKQNPMSFEEMGLSKFIRRSFSSKNIFTEAQLKAFVRENGVEAVKNLRNIGVKSFSQIQEMFPWLKDC